MAKKRPHPKPPRTGLARCRRLRRALRIWIARTAGVLPAGTQIAITYEPHPLGATVAAALGEDPPGSVVVIARWANRWAQLRLVEHDCERPDGPPVAEIVGRLHELSRFLIRCAQMNKPDPPRPGPTSPPAAADLYAPDGALTDTGGPTPPVGVPHPGAALWPIDITELNFWPPAAVNPPSPVPPSDLSIPHSAIRTPQFAAELVVSLVALDGRAVGRRPVTLPFVPHEGLWIEGLDGLGPGGAEPLAHYGPSLDRVDNVIWSVARGLFEVHLGEDRAGPDSGYTLAEAQAEYGPGWTWEATG